MFQLIESIKVENGQILNWPYHFARMQKSIGDLFGFPFTCNIDHIREELNDYSTGLFKLRITYDTLGLKHEIIPYKRKAIRSLKLVYSDDIDYAYKFKNRLDLNLLYEKRGAADDILIVKNALITDSYYCNIALLHSGTWYTPANPLLAGTKRASLIDKKLIKTSDIRDNQLSGYEKIRLFNAMIDFGEVELDIDAIL